LSLPKIASQFAEHFGRRAVTFLGRRGGFEDPKKVREARLPAILAATGLDFTPFGINSETVFDSLERRIEICR
jgi:hypothetical protein